VLVLALVRMALLLWFVLGVREHGPKILLTLTLYRPN
jgi:hypothetical protein